MSPYVEVGKHYSRCTEPVACVTSSCVLAGAASVVSVAASTALEDASHSGNATADVDKLKQDLANMKRKAVAMAKKLQAQHAAATKAFESQIAQLQSELQARTAETETLRHQLETLDDNNTGQQTEVQEIRQKLVTLQSDLVETRQKLAEANQKVAEAARQREELKRDSIPESEVKAERAQMQNILAAKDRELQAAQVSLTRLG